MDSPVAEERFGLAEPGVRGGEAGVELDGFGQLLLDLGEGLARGIGLPRQGREPVVARNALVEPSSAAFAYAAFASSALFSWSASSPSAT